MSKRKSQFNFTAEDLTMVLAGLVAITLAYLTFPSLVALVAPNAETVLWTSPISAKQGLSLLVGFVAFWILLNLAISIQSIKDHGGFEIPIWVIVGVFAVVSVALSVAVMMFAFSVTFTTLTVFGVESVIAGVVALLSAIIAACLLR